MRTAKFLSFLPGIRKLTGEVERLRGERDRQRDEIAIFRAERKVLRADLSELRKTHTNTLLELQTERSYAERALQSVYEGSDGASGFFQDEVSLNLTVDDDMLWKTTTLQYFRAGFAAFRLIHNYFDREKIDPSTIGSILDLPSGYGRVTRFLRAWRPDAKIFVCDLQEAGAKFCGENFGCEVVPAAENPAEISLKEPVDLIWCGSLVTHLSAENYRNFVQRFAEFLKPGGLLFFSNHGERAVERLTSGKTTYGLSEVDQAAVIADLKRDGFGYRDYPKLENYGISLASREWVEQLLQSIEGLDLVDYLPREWAGHHDVAVCRKP